MAQGIIPCFVCIIQRATGTEDYKRQYTSIQINETDHKLALYADDVLLTLSNMETSLPKTLETFSDFRRVSNLLLNVTKSEMLNISYEEQTLIQLTPNCHLKRQKSKLLAYQLPTVPDLLELSWVRKYAFEHTDTVYKEWIPNTNFDNASNWIGNRVPCSKDEVFFEKDKKVSVYVQASHSLTDMYLPLDGEFILAPESGFSASPGNNPDCERGSSIYFHDADQYLWVDPSVWKSALYTDDPEMSKSLFSVDAERIPCQHDDVIFTPETSFRVNFMISISEIQVKSISVQGRRFISDEEFAQHLQTNTGKLQFPSPVQIKITNSRCNDKTGCVCGNDRMIQEICSALMQHTDNKCPEASCVNPLKLIGHCCEICGAAIYLEYTSDFDLDIYRNRLIHTFLSLPTYSGVKLAISKVQRPQSPLGILPVESASEIQIVLIDDKSGSQTGSDAQQLAYDIMSDIDSNGKSFGIMKGTVHIATGSTSSAQQGHMTAGYIAGLVLGIFICIALVGLTFFLYRAGKLSFPSTRSLSFWRRKSESEDEHNVENNGFDNPIFAENLQNCPDVPEICTTGKDKPKEVTLKQSDTNFSNPLYDASSNDV
ncbi:protein amnionless [Bombina bombina]|uniref:protein amnionless n=1 Tax=Bombina bombina TaxID=8345 RepID=UPI00235B233C|nr:protein amnionless [Bombina bombina]